eukprot:NODE_258_length_12622_cov_0.213767.p7 type:complete len:117 gc:universal NODE_258_length_12622_cov_0.213767:1964-2314(+)
MLDRTEEKILHEREYRESHLLDDKELANNIHNDTTAYLNDLVEYQILQLQHELKSTVKPSLINQLKQEDVKIDIANQVIDIQAVAHHKTHELNWDEPSKSRPIEQEIALKSKFTED